MPPTGWPQTWNRTLMGFGSGTIILTGSIVTRSKRLGIRAWPRDRGFRLLLRAHARAGGEKYRDAAEKAFVSLTRPIAEGGVLFEDDQKNLWIEEYLVDPPTHILNGFIWALWGVFDYWLARADASAKRIFDRGVETLAQQPGSIRYRILVVVRAIGNSPENAGEPFLSSAAYRTVARDVEPDGRCSLYGGCRTLGELRAAAQQSNSRPDREKRFQIAPLLISR